MYGGQNPSEHMRKVPKVRMVMNNEARNDAIVNALHVRQASGPSYRLLLRHVCCPRWQQGELEVIVP